MILSAVPAARIVFELPIYHFVDDVIHHDERDITGRPGARYGRTVQDRCPRNIFK